MNNFQAIEKICHESSRISKSVVDEFLIYYAVERDRVDREVDKRLARYRHITRDLPDSALNFMKSQYIAWKIFRKGGLIKKYRNHQDLAHLTKEEKKYISKQAEHPWKFSFGVIINKPAEHFYRMQDVFTRETYLLFSPGMSDILQEQPVELWFNLIGYNGACWQTFSLIGAWKSFEPADIMFYTSCLNPRKWIEDPSEVLQEVESNPVPYMLLISGASLPVSYHNKDQIILKFAEFLDDDFSPDALRAHFRIEYAENIYKLTPEGWEELPHFSIVYYDEKENILLPSAMTDRGYAELIRRLNQCGYNLSDEPDHRVNITMLTTAGRILKQNFNPVARYSSLFAKEPSMEEEMEIDKINKLMELILPDINAGRVPDIEAVARQAGVDLETAKDLIRQIMKKLRR